MRNVLLLILFSLTGCCCFEHEMTPEEGRGAHRQLIERPSDDLTWTVEQVAAELKYDRRLHLENAMFCNGVDGPILHLEFITQSILELCDARQMLVDVVERFLYRLNSNYLDPSFKPEPFTANNLEIYINFESYYVLYVDRFYIGWVVLEDGEAFYYASTLKNNKLAFWHAHVEPYFKSKSIAMAQIEAEKHYRMTHPGPPSALKGELYRAPNFRGPPAFPAPPSRPIPLY